MTISEDFWTRLHTDLLNASGAVLIPNANSLDTKTVYQRAFETTVVKDKLSAFTQYRKTHEFLPVLGYEKFVNQGLARLVTSYVIDKNPGAPPGNYHKGSALDSVPGLITNKAALLSLYPTQIGIAKNEARARFSEHIQNIEWDALVDLAEADKTAKMMLTSVRNLTSYVRNFKKKNAAFYRNAKYVLRRYTSPGDYIGGLNSLNARRVRDVIGGLNSKYLEFTYGWIPLTYSVRDAAALLENRMHPHLAREKVSGHSFFVKENAFPFTGSLASGFANGTYERENSFRYDVWIGGKLKAPQEATLSQQLGATVQNIPAIIVELTRFSFIADYFVNVTDFVNNINAAYLKVEPATLYMSEKIVYNERFSKEVTVTPNPSTRVTATAVEKRPYNCVYFKRTSISPLDTLVRLNLKIPNVGQVFNTLSVIAQTARLFNK